ncbi:hypothetical protein EI977_14095 [Bacillus paralicheniformis]|nr:hypothetical protein SC10_B2orf05332 [Bacillus paralicheniformis]KYC84523.1 hypothetical protein B4091_3853 [Bacillus licheniformis]KAA0837196.1 hypothetical protein EI977_14095 [Bacillus paralicheniformis]KAA0842818.1 hypothetical protein EI979_04440 [Bacillus paralicheniformis]TWK60510.1 hypothetical protein CHCC20343_3432 [Bacillus licheniformis]
MFLFVIASKIHKRTLPLFFLSSTIANGIKALTSTKKETRPSFTLFSFPFFPDEYVTKTLWDKNEKNM